MAALFILALSTVPSTRIQNYRRWRWGADGLRGCSFGAPPEPGRHGGLQLLCVGGVFGYEV